MNELSSSVLALAVFPARKLAATDRSERAGFERGRDFNRVRHQGAGVAVFEQFAAARCGGSPRRGRVRYEVNLDRVFVRFYSLKFLFASVFMWHVSTVK